MTDKSYQIKVYGIEGSYKKTINTIDIMTKISFSSQLNGGQGELSITLNLPVDDKTFGKSDIIKVFCFDQKNIAGRLIYTGMITRIVRNLEPNGEFIELIAIGLFSMLSRIYFKDGIDYTFTKDQDPSLTIKDMIDYFNSIYTADRFSYSGVDTYGEDISIDFDRRKCIDVIRDIQRITNSRFFYVGPDGNIEYKNSSGSLTNHRLKIENQIDYFRSDEQIERTLNKVFVRYGIDNLGPVEDLESQTNYGIIEERISSVGVTTEESALIFGDEFVSQNKDERKQTTLVVNSKYDLESIKPGDMITLFNITYEFPPMIVNRIQYTSDSISIQLDKYETFAESVLSNNN